MNLDRISKLLAKCSERDRNFPATDLYNEGWMLRIVLDWLACHPGIDHTLSFNQSDKWYSEALLPSAFLARFRGDKLAESWTHADGVIGNFVIGANRDGDLTLSEDGSRLMVIEAKMFSKLSAGVKNASYYNQAARNVGCIAEVLCRAEISPEKFRKLGFFLIAPEEQIKGNVFAEHMTLPNIQKIVNHRVSEYNSSDKRKWFTDWFLPTLEHIQIREISWEELVALAQLKDPIGGAYLATFYDKCLEFNRYVPKQAGP
jgi:hypothetical protein